MKMLEFVQCCDSYIQTEIRPAKLNDIIKVEDYNLPFNESRLIDIVEMISSKKSLLELDTRIVALNSEELGDCTKEMDLGQLILCEDVPVLELVDALSTLCKNNKSLFTKKDSGKEIKLIKSICEGVNSKYSRNAFYVMPLKIILDIENKKGPKPMFLFSLFVRILCEGISVYLGWILSNKDKDKGSQVDISEPSTENPSSVETLRKSSIW